MANLVKLRAVIEQIKLHPELWDQEVWIRRVLDQDAPTTGNLVPMTCGTAACFAGWACLLEGHKPFFNDYAMQGSMVEVQEETAEGVSVDEDEDGRLREVQSLAQDILELTWGEARVLFNCDNSLEELERLVHILEGGGKIATEPEDEA